MNHWVVLCLPLYLIMGMGLLAVCDFYELGRLRVMNSSGMKRKFDFTLGVVIALVTLLWAQSVVAATSLSSMRIGQSSDKTRVVFDVKNIHQDNYKISRSDDASKVFIDFYGTQSFLTFKRKHLTDKRLFRINVASKNKHTRVTLELHNTHKYRSFALAKDANGKQRLVVDLLNTLVVANDKKTRTDKQTLPLQVKASPPPVTKPVHHKTPTNQSLNTKSISDAQVASVKTKVSDPTTSKEPKKQASKLGNPSLNGELSNRSPSVQASLKTTNTQPLKKAPTPTLTGLKQHDKLALAPTKPNQRLIEKAPESLLNKDSSVLSSEPSELVVALDPGHGGKDSGAIGFNGAYEKDVVLKIAKEMKRLIDKQPYMRAVMTRDADVFIPLSKRVKIAKSQKADLFISIHADAFHDRSIKGGSIYVLSERGASSTMAKLLQERENSALEEISLNKLDKDVAFALSDLSRESNIEDSHKLGKIVLKEMRKTVRMHKKTVQSAGFAVLKSIDMPSLLVETAFISNPSEAKRLINPVFQRKMASAIVDGLSAYAKRSMSNDGMNETHYVQYRVRRGDTLSEIAEAYNVSTVTLKRVNKLKNANSLFVGKRIKIPVSNKVVAGI